VAVQAAGIQQLAQGVMPWGRLSLYRLAAKLCNNRREEVLVTGTRSCAARLALRCGPVPPSTLLPLLLLSHPCKLNQAWTRNLLPHL
jgi:hypothetical protein